MWQLRRRTTPSQSNPCSSLPSPLLNERKALASTLWSFQNLNPTSDLSDYQIQFYRHIQILKMMRGGSMIKPFTLRFHLREGDDVKLTSGLGHFPPKVRTVVSGLQGTQPQKRLLAASLAQRDFFKYTTDGAGILYRTVQTEIANLIISALTALLTVR